MEDKPPVHAEELQSVTKIVFCDELLPIKQGDDDKTIYPARKVLLTVNNEHHYEAVISAFITEKKQVIALYANNRGAFTKVAANNGGGEPLRA